VLVLVLLSENFYVTENWTLRKVDQEYLGSSEIRYLRWVKISWIDCVRNAEVLLRVKWDRNMLYTV